MITRRALLGTAAAALVVGPAAADGFIALTDDGAHLTCPMPASESVVDVKLGDGSIIRAFYDSNIMEGS